MNVAMIIPTGIGCEIGGHAGDSSPAVKLIGKCCDKIIIHPNAVNASDINEMPANALYVEGSILDRFLANEIYLEEVFYNKILLAVNKPAAADTVNAMNAARANIGADIELMELDFELEMSGYYNNNGTAIGHVYGWEKLCEQVKNYEFDALAIQTHIKVNRATKLEYFKKGGVNPWGGIEAIASKLIADKLNKPVAHAPFDDRAEQADDLKDLEVVTDPRMAAEMVSVAFLHCVLKGLHKAPRIAYRTENVLTAYDVDFLITPVNCVGRPHQACMDAGIPIIAVKENKTVLNDKMPESFIIVDNYIEAAGLLMAYRAGITPESARRPLN